jgi:hypothetical protein
MGEARPGGGTELSRRCRPPPQQRRHRTRRLRPELTGRSLEAPPRAKTRGVVVVSEEAVVALVHGHTPLVGALGEGGAAAAALAAVQPPTGIDVIREAYQWDGPLTVVDGVGGREGMGLWGGPRLPLRAKARPGRWGGQGDGRPSTKWGDTTLGPHPPPTLGTGGSTSPSAVVALFLPTVCRPPHPPPVAHQRDG